MKQLTIDLENKVVEIEGLVTIDELIEFMKEHKFDTKEFSIRSKVIQFHTPSLPVYPSFPGPPWWQDQIVYCIDPVTP